MSFSPTFTTPFTDFEYLISPTYISTPKRYFCAKMQSKYFDCIEAYGLARGQTECAALYFDLLECLHSTTQALRYKEIQKERLKQFKAGKIDKLYQDPPPMDSFMYL